ncbi:MAG: SPOR domain-containing protein [Rickettsiaceae bacterium]|nr:MAG: SPOR domain-containing protein [Rickettsiaceae bacterium]
MAGKNLTKISINLLAVIIILVSIYIFGFSKENPKEIPIIYSDDVKIKIKPPENGKKVVTQSSGNLIYESMLTTTPYSSILTKRELILSEPEQPITFEKDQSLEENIVLSDDIFGKENNDFQHQSAEKAQSIFDEEITDLAQNYLASEHLEEKKTLNVITYDKELNSKIKERSMDSNNDKGYMVQLASVKTEAEGIAIGEILKHKHKKILGLYSIILKKIKDKNGKFFYLVLAGECPSISVAKSVCKKLVYRQQSCMIIKP